jgi:6-phosphogluconolactonase
VKRVRELHVYDEAIDVWRALEERWRALARRAGDEKGFFSVALSGGRTPVGFYCYLSRRKGLPWSGTELFQVDERQVPPGSEDSNFTMIRSSLLEGVQAQPRGIHPMPTGSGDAAASALEYEKELKTFFGSGSGWPVFDLILLGIGEDGHTASLFPGGGELAETGRWVIASRPKEAAHERVTLTLPVLNECRNVVLLATGKKKAEIVRRVWEAEPDSRLPASLVRPRGTLAIYVDRAAGSCP